MIKLDAGKFDNDFINTVEQLANALKVDPVMFIENIVLSRMAADQAADDVYQGGLQLMPEFLQYDGQQLKGRELYKMIYNLERARLEQEYINNLAAVPVEALTDHDREILRRHGQDPESKAKAAAEKSAYEKYKADLAAKGIKNRASWEE